MTYIVAFVKFSEQGQTYPFNCLRTDLVVGDAVLVRVSNSRLSQGTVVSLRFLNWDCNGLVLCKISECVEVDDGDVSPPKNAPLQVGLASRHHLHAYLVDAGWRPITPPSKTYRNALAASNRTHEARVLLRKNGVDLEMWAMTTDANEPPYRTQLPSYRSVHHHLPHTTFNLFEGIARFSASFLRDEPNYDRYFKSVGSLDRRTLDQKFRYSESEGDEMADIYWAISDGSGGPGYLGDGLWISSGGSVFEG